MVAVVHRLSAWDGLPLVVREWHDGNVRSPLLCLPGIVRTSGDFETLAHAIGAGRRVEHYEMAGYETAISLAQRIGRRDGLTVTWTSAGHSTRVT